MYICVCTQVRLVCVVCVPMKQRQQHSCHVLPIQSIYFYYYHYVLLLYLILSTADLDFSYSTEIQYSNKTTVANCSELFKNIDLFVEGCIQ